MAGVDWVGVRVLTLPEAYEAGSSPSHFRPSCARSARSSARRSDAFSALVRPYLIRFAADCDSCASRVLALRCLFRLMISAIGKLAHNSSNRHRNALLGI